MKRVRSSLVGWLALLFVAAAFWQVGPLPAQADAPCNTPTTLKQVAESSTAGPLCYRFTVPANTKVLRIKLEAKNNGAYDLYYKAGAANTLLNNDRLNAGRLPERWCTRSCRPAQAHTPS